MVVIDAAITTEVFAMQVGSLKLAVPAQLRRRPKQVVNLSGVQLAALFMVMDIACLGLAFAISYYIAGRMDRLPARIWKTTDGFFCISLLYLLLSSSGYSPSNVTNLVYQLSRILVNGTAVIFLEWLVLWLFGADTEFDWPWLGPINIVSAGAVGMCLTRVATMRFLAFAAQEGWVAHNVAIIGTGRQAELLVTALAAAASPWTHIVGCFDDRRSPRPDTGSSLMSAGTLDQLIASVQDKKIDEIIVALPWGAEDRLRSIFSRLKIIPANIRLAPDVIGHGFLRTGFEKLDGIPLYSIYAKPISGWSALAKRVEDIALATMLLICASPILALCVVAIRIESRGPIFFRQQRFGYNNQLIRITKFRSMYHEMRDEGAARLATRDDPRVTGVGRVLRRLSLDELPQLLDVLRGTMSLIGPRPHALEAKAAGRLYQEVVGEYIVRHKVKPGITGWAQVKGWRGETDTEEKIVARVQCDLYYIENWSIFLDMEILIRTFGAMFGKNAY